MAIATILGCLLGVFITGKERERLAEIVLYMAEILMTIPSLALFGLFMLLLAHLQLSAIGFLPALITLIVYGQLPILRNTYTAIRQVDPAIVEAGKGFVHYQDHRLQDQGPGYGRSLPHTAGYPVGIEALEPGQAEPLNKLRGFFPRPFGIDIF